jgi:hypothetical protein
MKRSKHRLARKSFGMAVLGIVALLLSSCGASTPSPNTVSTAVARSVAATVAAQPKPATLAPATAAMQPTAMPGPTNAPAQTPTTIPTTAPTKAVLPTGTPVPTNTARPTNTPAPSVTPPPTATPTRAPGLGDLFECGRDWSIKVIWPPVTGKVLGSTNFGEHGTLRISDAAKGAWLALLFELTNLQSKTDDLNMFGEELSIKGKLNGREVSFPPNTNGPSNSMEAAGVSSWSDDVPPGITATMLAVFDTNPAATDQALVLKTARCQVEIPLVDTRQGVVDAGSTDQPAILVGASNVNLRAGPGTGHSVVGQAEANRRYPIVGKTADNSWWQVAVSDKNAWVAASVVTALGPLSGVPVSQSIPTPPPAPPTAAPVALPKTVPLGQEFPTTLWGLKLYDVKRAKAVYFFGSSDIANGTWLIPFVEFRNLGSGTNQPSSNLHFYLQDAAGRTFDYDTWNDAELGAAWQFKAGHLYDKINPSSVLGIAIPFDVAPSLGDMWLRVKEAPGVAMYLGNVSQMQESK